MIRQGWEEGVSKYCAGNGLEDVVGEEDYKTFEPYKGDDVGHMVN